MKRFTAETTIDGTAGDVWAVLMDTKSHEDWDPGTRKIEGRISLEETIVVHSVAVNRAIKFKVTELDHNVRMTWVTGLPAGMFKAERTFELSQDDHQVHFTLSETLSGALSPLINRMIPDLTPSFQKFARGLKAEVESRIQTNG